MGKIVLMGDFVNKKQKNDLLGKIQEKVDEIEKELNLEEPLTVLTDDAMIAVLNDIEDIKDNLSNMSNSIKSICDTFNYDECEELPDEK